MATYNKETKTVNKAGHDTDAPPNLIGFMLSGWKQPSGVMPKALKHARQHAQRRAQLSAAFPGVALVVPTGHLVVRANDTHYRFRPGSDFYYLTGCTEPDCVLVMAPNGGGHDDQLYVEPNPGKTDATFYTDRIKGELWEGPRLGIPECAAKYQIPNCRSLRNLSAVLKDLQSKLGPDRVVVLPGMSSTTERDLGRLTPMPGDAKLASVLSEMRLYKDDSEIKELASAIAATKVGFEDVIARLRGAKNERELEGVFYTRARMDGNDVGYASIVAAGKHACTLHWSRNDGALKKGDLLLLDAGIEGNSLYTADVTRTLPISGKYTHAQRDIYDLVLAAQVAAMKAVKPGHDFLEPNRVAMRILAEGLADLRIMKYSAAEALRQENQYYRRYTLHNVSHMLGLDVHDCAKARAETYKFGTLEPKMVLTVEPGLYFQPDDLTVPAKYRGIGVRIEDDVVVTKSGCRNLSASLPTESKDVERWMASLWRKRSSR